jgi:hypothetical protein
LPSSINDGPIIGLGLVSGLGYPKKTQPIINRSTYNRRASGILQHRSVFDVISYKDSSSSSIQTPTTFVPSRIRNYSSSDPRSTISSYCIINTQLSAAASSSSSSSSNPSQNDNSNNITNSNDDHDDDPIPSQEQQQPKQNSDGSNNDDNNNDTNNNNNNMISSSVEKLDRRLAKLESKYVTRIARLEEIVSRQEIELHKLRKTCTELADVSEAFTQLLNLLRESGLDADGMGNSSSSNQSSSSSTSRASSSPSSSSSSSSSSGSSNRSNSRIIESFDDAMIFGRAPSSVIDAADAAGTAILAGMLGGKQRMLVDVRDAELSSDPETLVQFIELAILPVAAGLEGLKSTRNRVKIVFPKVSQLLQYRRSKSLACALYVFRLSS